MALLSGYNVTSGETSACRVGDTDYTVFTDNGDGTCTVDTNAEQQAQQIVAAADADVAAQQERR